MAEAALEERVATLEQLVAQLMHIAEKTAPPRRGPPTRMRMILLDTDHLSLLQARDTPGAFALQAHLKAFPPNAVLMSLALP